jgi:AcrR family transcriptional regulator
LLPIAQRLPADEINRSGYNVKRAKEIAKKTRAQKSEEARTALFQAAAEIVGQYGYADASISRITQRANLAQGTFYNYFASRQDILDQLLPALGTEMLAYIRERAIGGKTFLEREERAFRAFFDFLKKVPHFLRILNEAEISAPKAYHRHLQNVSKSYVRFLRGARDRGEVANLPDDELEALAYVMMAARGYLGVRYAKPNGKGQVPEYVMRAYTYLIANGLTTGAAAAQRQNVRTVRRAPRRDRKISAESRRRDGNRRKYM